MRDEGLIGTGPAPKLSPTNPVRQFQRMPVILPEGTPDTVRNRLSKMRLLTQVEMENVVSVASPSGASSAPGAV